MQYWPKATKPPEHFKQVIVLLHKIQLSSSVAHAMEKLSFIQKNSLQVQIPALSKVPGGQVVTQDGPRATNPLVQDVQ